MARLACESKMGYYPTDTSTIKKIIDKTIEFPENNQVYAVDCCAGEGEAIEFIGKEYNCITYAVEMNEDRALKCVEKEIDIVLNADALTGVSKRNNRFGLNFLNPPYDLDSSNNRLEVQFVQRWGQVTIKNGVLILVINPSGITEELVKTLRGQSYRPMYSFYDPNNEDFKKYGQFFLVLQRREPFFRSSTELFYELLENPTNIDEVEELEKIVSASGWRSETFKEVTLPKWKIDLALEHSTLKERFLKELKKVSFSNTSIEHPNDGQSAILIASGALNKEITLRNKTRIILKGTVSKIKKIVEVPRDDNSDVQLVKEIESYKTVIYGLDLSIGDFVKYE